MAGVEGLVVRGDPDGALPAHRALVLADPASGAARGIHDRPLQAPRRSLPDRLLDLLQMDRLRRDRAGFLADDARPLHRPGQAAPAADKRQADADRPRRPEAAAPAPLLERERPGGPGRAGGAG